MSYVHSKLEHFQQSVAINALQNPGYSEMDLQNVALAHVQVFNLVISKMVRVVLWSSPVGIASLIAASICRACNLASTLAALGLWVVTVLLGLLLQSGLVLPAVLWGCTRTSPWATIKGFSQAIVLGFGTSSSSAALPVSISFPFCFAVGGLMGAPNVLEAACSLSNGAFCLACMMDALLASS